MSGLAPLLVSPSTASAAADFAQFWLGIRRKPLLGLLQYVVQLKFVLKYGNAFVTAPIAKEDQLKPGKSDDSTAGQVSGKRAIEQKVQHCVLF